MIDPTPATEPAAEPAPEPTAPAPEPALPEPAPVPAPAPEPEPPTRGPAWARGLTRNVFVLGLVSLFTDVSSEMIVPIRILFLVGVLGTPLPLAGLIEGVAESTASLFKIVSGRMADRVSERKPLILAGYTLSNLTKPLLALVGAWPAALGIIFLDRIGKGVRSSPRDAVLADSAPAEHRGKAFGFHRAMDTLGAAFGPLLAFIILKLSQDDLRQVFAWTLIPGVISIGVLIFLLREPRRTRPAPAPTAAPSRLRLPSGAALQQQWAALGPRFWLFTVIATIFALGNSSDAFLFLRTQSQGLQQPLELVPIIYFGYNVVFALLAAPLGALSDRWGRLPMLVAGYAAFALVYLGWAQANQPWHVWALFLVYGIYAAATDGVGKALVTDLVPRELRGTAMGWFNGLTGLMALPANWLAGWLWNSFGPGAPFGFGAWLGFVAMALLLAWAPWLRGARPFRPPVPVPAPQPQEA